MSNRRCLLFLLFVALLGNAEMLFGQTSPVRLQFYDYAGLNPKSLEKTLALTQKILAEANLPVEVELCRGAGALPCTTQTGNHRSLSIRLLGGSTTANSRMLDSRLGQSIADREGGTYASLYLERVKDVAAERDIAWDIVLSYAAVHEVGHLLLGSTAHTSRGLMKANWTREDFEAMSQRHLHFTDSQCRLLADRYSHISSLPAN